MPLTAPRVRRDEVAWRVCPAASAGWPPGGSWQFWRLNSLIMGMAVSLWRHAIHGLLRENPDRSRFWACRRCLWRDRLPGERSRSGEGHANDVTHSGRCASNAAGSDVNASAVARTGRDATGYGEPAAA